MSCVHIIGAGLAGLAAAIELSGTDRRICLYEATSQAGGRCRSYHDPVLNREIDNGNHLILKANHHTRDYIQRIGSTSQFHTPQTHYPFIDIKYGYQWSLKRPFYLPRLPLIDYIHLLRIGLLGGCVADYVSPYDNLYRRFLSPLCTSILNTPPEQASAMLFARTLRQIIAEKGGAEPLLPLHTLHAALIAPALKLLLDQGCDIYYQQSLKHITLTDNRATELHFSRNVIPLGPYDIVILAIPAHGVEKLLPALTVPQTYHAIVNGHFIINHDQPHGSFIGAVGGALDWVFFKDGLISTTTSAANALADIDQDIAATMLWHDVCRITGVRNPLPPHRIVTEKRATYAATPNNLKRRPAPQTDYSNLLLAGDYVRNGLPATIEGAIKSGIKAACAVYAI